MKEKLKIAFIGGGINSVVGSAHYAAMNIDNDGELEAGCFSRNKKSNKETALKYRVSPSRVYDDINSLIEQEKDQIDVAVVLTPTDRHANHILQLLESGIPVISEKSLTSSVEDAMAVKSVLSKNNGFLSVIYNYLGYPMIRELKRMLTKGDLGIIKHIQVEMPQETFSKIDVQGNPVVPQDWRLKDNYIPTISLDLGVHLHMLIKYLTEEVPLSVIARSETYGNFPNIVDNVNCIIDYSNNISCNMWYSKIAIGNRNGMRIRVYGDRVSAEWIQESPEILYMANNRGERWWVDRGNPEMPISNLSRYTRFKAGHPAGYVEALANYYSDVFASLRGYLINKTVQNDDCFGIEESIEGLKLFHAVQKSSLSGEKTIID